MDGKIIFQSLFIAILLTLITSIFFSKKVECKYKEFCSYSVYHGFPFAWYQVFYLERTYGNEWLYGKMYWGNFFLDSFTWFFVWLFLRILIYYLRIKWEHANKRKG